MSVRPQAKSGTNRSRRRTGVTLAWRGVKRPLVMLLLLPVGCAERFTPPTDEVLLPIANRPWADGAPPEGWCGEVSIQMVALHYGAWLPQRHIHGLVPTKHADLWEDELPAAMTAAGLSYESWSGTSEPRFLQWLVEALRRGRPVIVGVKLVPDEHPDWEVDHLMPVVGFSPQGLVFDTNLEQGQQRIPFEHLGQSIVFTTQRRRQLAWAVLGTPAPLQVLRESAERVTLQLPDSGVVEVPADQPFFSAAQRAPARAAPAPR